MTSTYTVNTIKGLDWYDVDANLFKPFNSGILAEVEAVKCDGEYFRVPEGSNDLAKVAVKENMVDEHEVLGTVGMVEKYLEKLQPKLLEEV